MEIRMFYRYGSQLFVGDLDPGFIIRFVESCLDTQSLVGCRAANQVHDDLSTQERSGSPVFSYVAKHPVFYFVPFAGARWKMTDMDHHRQLIGQPLQFNLPQLHPKTVAPATVRCDKQFLGLGVYQAAHCIPPSTDGFDCKSSRVMGDANTHPALILKNVIHTVGNHLDKALVSK